MTIEDLEMNETPANDGSIKIEDLQFLEIRDRPLTLASSASASDETEAGGASPSDDGWSYSDTDAAGLSGDDSSHASTRKSKGKESPRSVGASEEATNSNGKRPRAPEELFEEAKKRKRMERNRASAKKSHDAKNERKENAKERCRRLARELGLPCKAFVVPEHLAIKGKGTRAQGSMHNPPVDKKERNRESARRFRQRVKLETEFYLQQIQKLKNLGMKRDR